MRDGMAEDFMMNIQFRDAESLQPDNLRMNVWINTGTSGWIEYHLSPTDTDMTIDNGALLELIGDDFIPYVAPTAEEAAATEAERVRERRSVILEVVVDPLVSNPLRWADLSSSKQAEWVAFRTALLGITEQSGFPHTVTWPTQPE
tara:strand:- start:76 stop:513 length:438 start_codon:yes stop_codon:yes gene_type:complete